MSLTEITFPPRLNETVMTETGVAEASITVKRLSVTRQSDGAKSLLVEARGTEIRFILQQNECVHLAELLTE